MGTLYRGGKLGDSLMEALDVLVTEGKISSTLAMEVCSKFDQAMLRALEERVTAKATLKGKLDVYRYFDNVWTFVLPNASLRVAPTLNSQKKDEEEIDIEGPLKLVVVDSKIVRAAGEAAEGGGDK